jgi:hypothetical protein
MCATPESLLLVLEVITPLELRATNLLTELRSQTGELFPTQLPPEIRPQVITATVELVGYTRRCSEMARRLSHLQPIPFRLPLPEKAHEPR